MATSPAEQQYDRIVEDLANSTPETDPQHDAKVSAMMSAADNVELTERENGAPLEADAWFELWTSSYYCALEG